MSKYTGPHKSSGKRMKRRASSPSATGEEAENPTNAFLKVAAEDQMPSADEQTYIPRKQPYTLKKSILFCTGIGMISNTMDMFKMLASYLP